MQVLVSRLCFQHRLPKAKPKGLPSESLLSTRKALGIGWHCLHHQLRMETSKGLPSESLHPSPTAGQVSLSSQSATSKFSGEARIESHAGEPPASLSVRAEKWRHCRRCKAIRQTRTTAQAGIAVSANHTNKLKLKLAAELWVQLS